MDLDKIRSFVMSLGLIALIAAAVAIALTEFQASDSVTTGSYADNITANGLAGINNVMEYADTWGTIIGVVALISIVVGGFYIFQR